MRSIPVAMAWEMFRYQRWLLLVGATFTILFSSLVFNTLRHSGPLAEDHPSMIILHVMLIQLNIGVFGATVIASQCKLSRLYTYPISTEAIAGWQLLLTMAAVFVQGAVTSLFLNAAFDFSLPVWGPAIFGAVAVAAVQSALWFTQKTGWLPISIALVGGVAGTWFKSRYGSPFSLPQYYWDTLRPTEVATMAAFAALAFWAGVVAIRRSRRSETLRGLGIVDLVTRLYEAADRRTLNVSTPVQAHFWAEWHRKGWLMPATVAFPMIIASLAWAIFSRDANQLFEGFVVGGGLLSLAGLVGAVAMGNVGSKEGDLHIGPFLGTRPISDSDLARTILRVCATSVFVTWCLWLSTLIALYCLLRYTGHLARPWSPLDVGWWYLPATLSGIWIVAAVGTSMLLLGRSWLLIRLLFAFLTLHISFFVASKFWLSPETEKVVVDAVFVAFILITVVGTISLFWKAHQLSLVGIPTIALFAAVGTVLLTTIAVARTSHPDDPLTGYWLMAWGVFLMIAPVAAAPLAIRLNRHR